MFALERLKLAWRRLGRVETIFISVLLLDLALEFPLAGSATLGLLRFLVYVLGAWVLLRLARRGIRKAIWRLRNRLMVTYVFIAVIPVALILVLMGLGIWMATTQVAVYLVTSELDRRTTSLKAISYWLANIPARNRGESIGQILPYYRERNPGLEILVKDAAEHRYPEDATIESPEGWGDAAGAVLRQGRLYAWGRSQGSGGEVTLLAPLTAGILSEMVPRLGEVNYHDLIENNPETKQASAVPRIRVGKKVMAADAGSEPPRDHLPPAVNRLDVEVRWWSVLPVALWESPGRTDAVMLSVRSRPSAVLAAVSARKADYEQSLLPSLFVLVAVLFLVVELVSLIIGISLTRTILNAVHGLYEATLRVKEADFSHRIEVKRDDQLADLSRSFNDMTGNLERLLAVSKEKERLQSELEIAREVQAQLYPRSLPELRTLALKACCNPARIVSGDYYDYQTLGEDRIALAIGDVAGKGISAALLMATVESSVRTQLRHCLEDMVAAGGNGRVPVSTSRLVAQLNQQLYAHTSPEKYATFIVGVYEESSGMLTYTNAGHLPPILIRRGEPRLLEVNGTVVGAFPFFEWEESRLQLESGDLLLFYTDGVTEPENEYGEMFGDQRLTELLVKHSTRETDEIVAAITESVRLWTGSTDLQDDMTMLVARRL